MRHLRALAPLLAILCVPTPAGAHNGAHPSVHDTVAGVVDRLKRTRDGRTIRRLNRARAERVLTAEERDILATGHLTFRVNQPVLVTVFHDRALAKDPFWLRTNGWQPRRSTPLQVSSDAFDGWQKSFPAGEIGLGVNSLGGGGRHYFVALSPATSTPLTVEDLYPGQLRTTNFVTGATPWVDRDETLPAIATEFAGQTLIQTLHARRDDGRLVGRVLWTEHPSGRRPDHIVLTWSGDPRTTQAIQWRTAPTVASGAALYIESLNARTALSDWRRLEASSASMTSVTTANDPVVRRHTVELTGLTPGTTYSYRVGDGSPGGWSEVRSFTTAPPEPRPFAFVYMGDAQNGLDTWGKLVRGAYRSRPDVAFYLMAGDLVNRGNERDDWDEFFQNARDVFDRRTLVPVLGNHECQGGRPSLYLEQFALPHNGPSGIEPERAYSFTYGNAFFVVLDSNLPPENQVDWLDRQLGESRARWKIVTYHHPAYSSAPQRDNKLLREMWTPIFDRHGVDLALQGHDHAYLRTHPLRGGERVNDTSAGTTYIVSVSGTKFYRQAARPETSVGFTDVATWQVLDLEIDGDRLTYRAYDRRGQIRDEFVIDKSGDT